MSRVLPDLERSINWLNFTLDPVDGLKMGNGRV